MLTLLDREKISALLSAYKSMGLKYTYTTIGKMYIKDHHYSSKLFTIVIEDNQFTPMFTFTKNVSLDIIYSDINNYLLERDKKPKKYKASIVEEIY